MGVVQRLAGDNPTRHEAARRGYDSTMAMRVVRYSVGNENNPSDPWGRSELMIGADGVARLDHFYSRRVPSTGAWTGSATQVQNKSAGLVHLIAGSPEYQLV